MVEKLPPPRPAMMPVRVEADAAPLVDVVAKLREPSGPAPSERVSLADIEAVVRTPAKKTIINRMSEARRERRPVPQPLKTRGTSEDLYLYSALREWLIAEFSSSDLDSRLPEGIAEIWAELERCQSVQ